MATDRISVRLDKEKIEFLEQVGGDPIKRKGNRTRGVEAVIAFAQMTPRAFRAFLNGERFADVGELKRWDEASDADDAEVCPVCREEIVEVCQCNNSET